MDDAPAPDRARAPHLLLAGGGTGGHVFPALAVGDEMARRGWRVSWVGRGEGMERRLVAQRPWRYHALPALPVVGKSWWRRLRAGLTLGRSTLRAVRLVRRIGADVVVGTGGYASAPAALGGRLAGRPLFLIEPNARAGAANRLLSRWSQGAFLGHAEAAAQLACPTRVTGIPLRDEFGAPAPLPGAPPRLLVLGGSQGALELNRLLPAALAGMRRRPAGLTVVHQVGEAHLEAARAAYAGRELGDARVEFVAFIEDVASAMAAAHLVISRAGALTLAEIAASRRPAVLIPLTWAAGHQVENAERQAAAGAADALVGAAASAERLAACLDALLADRARLETMAAAAGRLARPGAVGEIADALEGARRAA